MAVERRFVPASSLARLIEREGGRPDRLVEAHFPARSDRTQLVRVERGRASLILRSTTPDGQVSEEAVEVPLSHAEALVEVAAGTVAFDRTAVPLGSGVEAVLDRFILPQGLALLTVRITGDPRLFAPPLWLGPEVTGDEAFEARELAISGLPAIDEVEVTNAALDVLLDTLEGRGARRARAPDPQRTSRQLEPSTGARTDAPASHRTGPPAAAAAALTSATPHPTEPLSDAPLRDEGEPTRDLLMDAPLAPDMSSLPPPKSFGPQSADPPLIIEPVNEDEETSSTSAVTEPDAGPQAPAAGDLVEAAIERLFAPAGADTQAKEREASSNHAALPDVEDGRSLGEPQPAPSRRPALRTNIRELDDGIARLARSLAPRGPRPPR